MPAWPAQLPSEAEALVGFRTYCSAAPDQCPNRCSQIFVSRLKGVISRSRGATVVFVDEPTEEWSADHGAVPGRCSRYRLGWCEIEASMGSVPVVVLDVLVGCEKSITLLTWEFTGRLGPYNGHCRDSGSAY